MHILAPTPLSREVLSDHVVRSFVHNLFSMFFSATTLDISILDEFSLWQKYILNIHVMVICEEPHSPFASFAYSIFLVENYMW